MEKVSPVQTDEKLLPAGGARLTVLIALVAVAGAFLLGAQACPREKEVVRYTRPVVSIGEMMENLPDLNLSLGEKIVLETVKPVQVAVAPEGALLDVNEFCVAGGYALRAETPTEGDAPEQPTAAPPPPPILPKSYGQRDGSDLVLSLPLSNGDRPAFQFKVRGDEYRWVTDGDSIVFRQDRFWWVEPVVKGAGILGLGYTVGRFTR
jgi:hypothetical protein